MTKQREFGLDLTRAAAVTLVLSVHFFQNSGYYQMPILGKTMVLATMARMACMTCVPLFMMLTGWLCIDRWRSPGYYRKLLPILLTYVLAGCVCMVFNVVWQGVEITPLDAVCHLLDFNAAPYGWYVEMYIGLFLLSPFLNVAWRGLDGKGRRALVITMLMVTAVPPVANALGQILPDWWTGLYPLTYYFLGAWLREHPIKASGWLLFLGWAAFSALAGGIVCWRQWGGGLTYQEWNYYQSLLVAGESVCLFSLLTRCGGTGVPAPVRWCVGKLSQLSLPIYLLSYITDQLLYPHLTAAFPDMLGRLPWLPVMVLAGLIGAGVLAQVVDLAVKALMRLAPRMEKQTQG